jgi:hypothetical protein
MRRQGLLLLVLALVCGCGADRSDVCGVYTTKYTHGSETLTLATNATFTQVYTPADGHRTKTNSGIWEFWRDDGKVLLRDAIDWTEHGTQSLEKTTMLMKAANRFGKISLIWGEEGVEEFDKKK